MTTYIGPNYVKLILDKSQIDYDDPGNGTPAIVSYKGGTGTYWRVINEGTVDTADGEITLPDDAIEWLDNMGVIVDNMYEGE